MDNSIPVSYTHLTFPGTLLQSGSRGTDVRLIQERLNFIAMYYKNIPTIVADGIYGPLTTNSVRAFQTMLGLSVDCLLYTSFQLCLNLFLHTRSNCNILTVDLDFHLKSLLIYT